MNRFTQMKPKKRRLLSLSGLLAAVALSLPAGAQSATEIIGRVADQTGAIVPNATVTAHNEATNQDITTVTTGTGDFVFPTLRPGTYDVTATAKGFDTAVETAIQLHLEAVVTVNLKLKLGSVSESVTVRADDIQLDMTHASRGEVFTQDELEQAPLNSGNPLLIMNSQPGVTFQGTNVAASQWVRPFDHQSINQFSVNGGASDSNDFQMDGAPNNSITFGARDIGTVPPAATVQEMKFITNPYDAQYGHTGGGIFDIVTKYGTNTPHGQVYYNVRRTWLDANTELSDSQDLAKASDSRYQTGFELDGPVFVPHFYDGRDKTFFELQYEHYLQHDPQTMVNSVPECSPGSQTISGTMQTCTQSVAQTGDFSGAYYTAANGTNQPLSIYNPFTITTPYDTTDPRAQFANNQIPTSLIDPTAKAVLSYLPLPNRVTPSNLPWGENNYAWSIAGRIPYDSATVRLDRNFGEKDRTYARYSWTKNWQINEDAQTFDSLPGVVARDLQPLVFQTHFGIADWQHTFSANSLFDIHLSFQRFAYNQNQGPSPFDLSNIGLSGLDSSVTEQVFPQFSIGGYGGVSEFGNNADNGGNKLTISTTIAAMPMWTYIRGSHSMKMGVDYRLQRSSTYYGGDASGEFNVGDWYTQQYASCLGCIIGQGSGLATMMLGIADGGGIYTGTRQLFNYPYAAPFFQDDWKVSKRLTLNLGLRWDIQNAPTEQNNKIVGGFDTNVINPVNAAVAATGLLPDGTTLTGGLTFAGVNGQMRPIYHTNRFLVQPRFGFNFALDNKTVVRGGFGTTYLQFTGQSYDQGFTASTSYVSSTTNGTTVNGSLISNPFPTIAKPLGSSLGLESSLGNSFSFSNPNFQVPLTMNYSFGVERQLNAHTTVDVSYVGSHGLKLDSSDNINHISSQYAASCNIEMGVTIARYENCVHDTRATASNYVTNPFAGIAAFSPTNTGNQLDYYYAGQLDSSVYSRPHPQFGDITETELNEGYSEFDSLQVVATHRWHDALTAHANFVWAKQMDGGGWADETYRIRAHYIDGGVRRWRWAGNADWHLPVGRGRTFLGHTNRIVDAVVGNWIMGAVFTAEAGLVPPLTRGGPAYGLEFKDVTHYGVHDRLETQRVIRGMTKCVGWYDPNPNINDAGGPSAGNPAYSLGDVAPNDYEGCTLNDAGTGHNYDYVVRPQFAVVQNVSDTGVRGPRGYNLDFSMSKSFDTFRKAKLEVRFEGYDVLNHPQWLGEDYWVYAQDSGSHFGTINKYYDGQTNIPRQVQLSAKIVW